MKQPETLAGPSAQVEALSFSASFVPDTWDDGQCTVDCVFYSGASVPRVDYWTGDPYDLVLSLDAANVRLDRLNNGAPVCDNHDTYGSVMNQLGVVQKAWLDGTARATLQISPREELAGLRADIKAGIIRNVSMGAWIYTKQETTPKGQDRKQFTAVDWEPYEISLTPVPADPGAVLMSANGAVAAPTAARSHGPKEIAQMDPETIQAGAVARPGTAAPPVNEEALRTEATTAERLRASEIRKISAAVHMDEAFTAQLIDGGVSIDEARRQILEKMAARSAAEHQTNPNNPGALVLNDAADKANIVMSAELLHRWDARAYPIPAGVPRDYASFTLMEMAKDRLRVKGVSLSGKSPSEVAFGALTTSDLPNILANVLNKTLRQGYQAAPRTFTEFARQTSAKDFKPVQRTQLSDLGALQPLNEKGEYHATAITDSKQTYQLATYGEKVCITRKVIINDDLEALTRVPFQLGVAAARLESDTMWAVITANQVMSEDNTACFHANHSNLITGAGSALGVTALATARSKMRLQTGPKGTILNLVPSFLVVPTVLETAALQLISPINLVATTDPTKVIPEWIRTLTPVVEPRLDAASQTAWYLFARPVLIDTFEFCYLEGQDGVYIETFQGFDVDGFEIKARLDFAAAAIDYRGLQKNAGA